MTYIVSKVAWLSSQPTLYVRVKMHEHRVLYLLIGKLVYRWEETKIRNYLKHISSLHSTKQSDDNVLGFFLHNYFSLWFCFLETSHWGGRVLNFLDSKARQTTVHQHCYGIRMEYIEQWHKNLKHIIINWNVNHLHNDGDLLNGHRMHVINKEHGNCQ